MARATQDPSMWEDEDVALGWLVAPLWNQDRSVPAGPGPGGVRPDVPSLLSPRRGGHRRPDDSRGPRPADDRHSGPSPPASRPPKGSPDPHACARTVRPARTSRRSFVHRVHDPARGECHLLLVAECEDAVKIGFVRSAIPRVRPSSGVTDGRADWFRSRAFATLLPALGRHSGGIGFVWLLTHTRLFSFSLPSWRNWLRSRFRGSRCRKSGVERAFMISRSL